MTMETQSLEDMIEGDAGDVPAAAPAETAHQMGVPDSAAPPADANLQEVPREDGPTVPRKALEDERKKRQEYERRVAEMERQFQTQRQPQQQQMEPPDPFVDPEGAFRYQQAVFAQQRYADRVATCDEIYREKFEDYDATVNLAIERLGQDPQFAAQLFNHPLPGKYAYEIGRKLKWQDEIGNDPEAYRSRLEAEILAKHGLAPGSDQPRAQAQAPARPRAQVPKSLASTASAQPRNERGQFAGPTPLEDIIG